MASFWSKLKAQLNPFDNGQTWDTVANNKRVGYRQFPQANQGTRGATQQPKVNVQALQQAMTQRKPAAGNSYLNSLKMGVRDIFDANTQADYIRRQAKSGLWESSNQQRDRLRKAEYERELKAAQAKKYRQDLPSKAVNTLTAGTGRGAVGIAQDLSGLVDLVTPGKGTSDFTKLMASKGKLWDEKAKLAGLNKGAYTVAQAPINIAAFASPGKVAKGIGVGQKGVKIGKTVSVSPRVIAGAADVIADTLQNAGNRTSKGQDNSAKTAGIDAGLSLATGGAISAGGKLVGTAVKKVASNADKVVRKLGIKPPTKLNASELNDLLNFRREVGTGSTLDNGLYERGRAAAKKAGIDYRSNDQIDSVLNAHLDYEVSKSNKKPVFKPLNQGGYIQLPGGKDIDPLESLKQEARKYKTADEFIAATRDMKVGDGGIPISTANELYKGVDGTEAGVIKRLTELFNDAKNLAPKKNLINRNDGGRAMSVDPLEAYIKKIRQPIEKELKEAQAELDKYGTGYINDTKRAGEQAKAKFRLDRAKEADWQNSESNLRAKAKSDDAAFKSSVEQSRRAAQGVEYRNKSEPWYKAREEIKNNYLSKFKNADDFVADFNTNDGVIPRDLKNTALTNRQYSSKEEMVKELTDLYDQALKESQPKAKGTEKLKPAKSPTPTGEKSVQQRIKALETSIAMSDTAEGSLSYEKELLKIDPTNSSIRDSLKATQPTKGAIPERAQKVAEHAKQKAKRVYEATGDVQAAKDAHNKVIDKARELKQSSTPQSRGVSDIVPAALDSQANTPNQSQSVRSSQLPQTSPVVQSSETPKQQPLQGRTENTPGEQNSQSSTSSDNIIDLKTIDVNDPFKNNSLTQKFRNEFGKYFIDEDSEMINLLKRIEKETKSKDLVEQWLQDTDLVRASNSIANSKLRNNQNLSDALNGLRKKDLADFDRYASARSELSNVERGLTSTSQSLDSLQKTVDDLGGKFGQRFDSLNRYYNDLSNDLYEAGVIDRATRDKWSQNKDYVRVQRDMEDLLSPQVGSSRSRSFGSTSTSKKRTGSQRDILSSTQTALKRGQEIQLEIQRNKAATNIIDTLTKYGIAEKIPSTQAAGKNVIKRFKDGKVEYFATSKDIKRVIDNVNPIQLGVIARVISAPTRLFRVGTTALSAPFAVTNYARDQMSSAIYSKNVLATHNPKTIVSGLYGALKDFGGVQNDPLWKKFEQIAGDQTIFDELRNSKNSKKMLTEIRRGGGGKARAVEILNPLNTVRTLEDLIGVTEKSTRFQNFKGIYEKAKRQGVSEDVAIRRATQAALQNSVNFSRAGQVTRIANLMFPYFNAGIQGSRNVGRSLRDRPVATTAKSVAFLGIPALAAALYNYEDEERRKIYENIPETEKENGFVFVLPGAKQREDGTYEGIIKIPKPQGYRELTDPLRVVAEAFAGAEDSKSVAEMLKDMVPAFSGPIQTGDMNKFTSTFVPQMVKPLLQAHLNKDLYWGSDTVPEYMVEGTDDPTKRAYKNTSGMARFIADQLKVSPILVEKAIIDTTGALGRYGVNAVDTALAKAGKIPEEQIGGRSIKSDFSRRMFEARGIEKEEKNMTDGQKYFKAVKAATANMKPQEKTAWDSYNQSNKNFLGEVIYDKNSQAKKQAKAAAYIDHPRLFQTDKKIDAEARKRGEPGNPLYDLTYQQALMVVQQKALPPGAKDEGLNKLYDQPWYQKFKNDEDKFYEKVFAGRENDNGNPYPTRSTELTKAMDYYYNLPNSYEKSRFKKANPAIADQMDAYYESKRNWTNAERAKIGLPPIEEETYGSSGGSKSGGKKGGRRKTAKLKARVPKLATIRVSRPKDVKIKNFKKPSLKVAKISTKSRGKKVKVKAMTG